ncbi:dynamin family protein [Thermosynechococcus sp. FA-CM-4201]
MATAIPHGIPQDIEPRETLVEDLRQDVIHLLKQAVDIVERYNNLHKTTGTEFSGTLAIRQALANVEEIALRMAVVAPMKAGKSTIINAIVGQPLLPARNTAMTAIATEIILDINYPEPVLFVPQETRTILEDTAEQIRQECHQNRVEVEARLRQQYPHLLKTLIDIISNYTLLAPQTTGVENVCTSLQIMNDLVRLASEIVPPYNPVKWMRELPQIRVAPFTLEGEVINAGLGNLVIIDTPPPNEVGENLGIKNIFAQQIQRSSLALVVLDFTQLNTEAAKSVQDTVQAIAEIRSDTENVYALVNKVDQRRRGDMTPEEVREFVQRTFNIPSPHVFEVSAQRAYCAARFLKQPNLGEDWQRQPETRDLAQEILGNNWERDLEVITREELTARAKQQWYQHSNFYYFYVNTIHELRKNPIPRLIQESLKTIYGFMNQLLQSIELEKKNYQSDINRYKNKINQIDESIEELSKLIDIDSIITAHHTYQQLYNKSSKLRFSMWFYSYSVDQNTVSQTIKDTIYDKVNKINKHIDKKMYNFLKKLKNQMKEDYDFTFSCSISSAPTKTFKSLEIPKITHLSELSTKLEETAMIVNQYLEQYARANLHQYIDHLSDCKKNCENKVYQFIEYYNSLDEIEINIRSILQMMPIYLSRLKYFFGV